MAGVLMTGVVVAPVAGAVSLRARLMGLVLQDEMSFSNDFSLAKQQMEHFRMAVQIPFRSSVVLLLHPVTLSIFAFFSFFSQKSFLDLWLQKSWPVWQSWAASIACLVYACRSEHGKNAFLTKPVP